MLLNELQEWITGPGIALGLLTFLGGLVIGNRLNLGRERRTEWNTVVDRVRAALIKAEGYGWGFPDLDAADIDRLRHQGSRRFRRRFDVAVERMNTLRSQYHRDKAGGWFYTPEQVREVVALRHELLSLVKRKV